MCFRITGDFGNHVHGNRLHRWSAIAAMGALAINHRLGGHGIKIHGCDRVNRVDQAHRIGPPRFGGTGRKADIGDIWG